MQVNVLAAAAGTGHCSSTCACCLFTSRQGQVGVQSNVIQTTTGTCTDTAWAPVQAPGKA